MFGDDVLCLVLVLVFGARAWFWCVVLGSGVSFLVLVCRAWSGVLLLVVVCRVVVIRAKTGKF